MTIFASQSHNPGDLETRFSQLLQPIRDLTKNWDVNIAEHLEDYLSELEKVTVSFDGGLTTMNFAEAAMVIQGSACVYSKKVEYLYTLVYQTLDLVVNKKRQKANKDENSNNDDVLDDNDEDEEFLTLDDIQEHKNIVLKEESDDKSIPPVPQIPLSLIPFDDCEKGDKPLLSKSGEVLASRNDFKMNTCSVHTTGTLLLDMTHLSLLEKSLQMSFSSCESMHTDQPNSIQDPVHMAENGEQVNNMSHDGDHDHVFDMPHDDDADVEALPVDGGNSEMPPTDEVDGGAPDLPNQNAMDTEDGITEEVVGLRRSQKTKQVKIPTKPVVNVMEPLEPHDAGKIEEKTIKKGKSYVRIPLCLRDPSSKKRKRHPAPEKQPPLKQYLTKHAGSLKPTFPKNQMKASTFSEFEVKYYEEYKRRLSALKNERKLKSHTEDVEEEDDDDEPENIVDNPEGDGFGFDGEEADDLNDSPLIDDKLFQAMESAMATHQEGFESTRGRSEGNFIADSSVISDYEELVRQHVDQYLASAQEYAQITELSQRVSDWEDKVLPKLEEEDKRPPFDINIYGSFILDNLEKKKTVPFKQIVKHKPTFEICRIFLASLMLANTSNIKIYQKGDFQEGVDKYELELLTKVRHFEQLEEYQAPSITKS